MIRGMNKNKQLIYVDESGIHKTTEHSSFALVYISIDKKSIVQDEIINIEKSLMVRKKNKEKLS